MGKFLAVDILFGHGQQLIQILPCFDHHQTRHQLGDRGNRQRDRRVFLEQDFIGGLIHHQRDIRAQRQGVWGEVEAGKVARSQYRRHTSQCRCKRYFLISTAAFGTGLLNAAAFQCHLTPTMLACLSGVARLALGLGTTCPHHFLFGLGIRGSLRG